MITLASNSYAPTPKTRTLNEAGFTLIEVLISLFIFALISVGTMTALTQSLQGKTRLDEAVADINEINSLRAILRADISSITLRPMRDELGGILPYSLTSDGEALLTFTRRGRQNPGGLETRGDLERVEYHLINDEFIRRSFAHENPSSDPAYFDRVLIGGLEDVTLRAHIASQRTNIAGISTIATEQIRVETDQLFVEDFDDEQGPIQTQRPELPRAISFEITDQLGGTMTHFFELGL